MFKMSFLDVTPCCFSLLASFLNIRELQFPFAACLIFVVIAASDT